MINKRTHKKPLYKDILISRKNILNNTKIFYFKKKKWERFIFFAKRNFRFFRRHRFYDQSKLTVSKFSSSGNAFKKYFKNFLIKLKMVNLLYGGFKKKKIKTLFLEQKNSKKTHHGSVNQSILSNFEKRLDASLTKAKFCLTPKQARQMISHGHILVNGERVRSSNCVLEHGDKVQIARTEKSMSIVKQNLLKSNFWPVPPSNLRINYKTLTIVNIQKASKKSEIVAPFYLSLNFLKNRIKFR